MEEFLKDKNEKILIMVGASWCNPCQKMTPDFKSLSNMNKFKDIEFIKLDLDNDEEICEELEIEHLPTFIYYKDKVEVKRQCIKTLLEMHTFINKK
jgi:thioredoxin 1